MGIELLQEALEVARREGLTEVERTCRVALAEAHRRLGDLESAYRALVDAYASERTYVRAERARYQAFLSCIKVITPRGEQATVASSLESLRALLKEGTLAERTLGIARIEIDHVKELRERFGDARLNAIRERVVTLLQLSLRSGDILARHGTDEFVIALRGATPRQARRIAERLRNAVGTADWVNLGEELAVTLSIGLCIGASGIDPEAVIQAADRCLDDARSSGRNQIAVGRAAA